MDQLPFLLSELTTALPPSKLTSALPVVQQIVELVKNIGGPEITAEQRRALALEALNKIAAGNDGVYGTEDDRISPMVMDQIRMLIESNLADSLVAHFQDFVAQTVQEVVPESVRASPWWNIFSRLCGCTRPAVA